MFTDVQILGQGKRFYALSTNNAADTSSGCNSSNGIPSAIVLIKKGTDKINQQWKSVNKVLISKIVKKGFVNIYNPIFMHNIFFLIRIH